MTSFLNKIFLSLNISLPDIQIKDWVLVTLFSILSIVSMYITFNRGYVIAYNDARSHLDMARLVIDNLNPGLAQIGSVWLPLNHLLTLTLVWNDWLWHTGLAGAIFSMIFYVLSCIVLFKLINLVIRDRTSSLLGTLVFATNLNVLYMQSTPMTELTLIFFFVSTTYFLYRWVNSNNLLDLLYTATCVFLATLTRYDGWFLFVVVTGTVALSTTLSVIKKNASLKVNISSIFKNRGLIEGKTILFVTLASLGIGLWLLWNLAIFGEALYFSNGPYSARAQQVKIQAAGGLLTIHNLPLSLSAYWWAMVNNAGFLLMVFSICGLIIYATKNKLSGKAIAIYSLLVPLVFHVVSLYMGQSILILPELGVNVTQKASTSWFNVRYGLMILPAVAFFAGFLAAKNKIAKTILILLIVIEPLIFFYTKNVVTLTDGVRGTSSLKVGDVAEWIADNAKKDDGLILVSISFNNALTFSSGLPLKRYIHEGTGKYWETSLINPSIYAKWIIMANGDVGDPVYDALIKQENSTFLKQFRLVIKFDHLNIYERIEAPENFIYTENNEFNLDGSIFRFVGVNSYDLVYLAPQKIEETISKAQDAGVKVIRFWAFGDGLESGIQPKPGEFNESALRNLDLVMVTAKRHNIKVIVTMVNYWGDYGGMAQYLRWNNLPESIPSELDAFYINPEVRNLYKNYVKTLITRKNTITNITYANDPTIFAWELANEPRASIFATTERMLSWAVEMSNYVHSLDKSHLVLSGTEGFLSNPDFTSTYTGPSFDEIGKITNFMGLTAHYYVQNTKLLNDDFSFPALSEWKKKADQNAKPMILEEVGFHKKAEENNGVDRLVLYKNLFDQVYGHGVQGVMLWNWALSTDDNFGISPNDKNDQKLIDLIKTYSLKIENK